MTPVINPWIFYIMPLCEKFSIAMWVSFAFLGAFTLGLAISMMCEYDSYRPDEDKIKRYKSILKKVVVWSVIFGVLACLIPSEETITKMLVAQNVTYDRVEVVTDTVANVYNDIMNLFQDSGAANG